MFVVAHICVTRDCASVTPGVTLRHISISLIRLVARLSVIRPRSFLSQTKSDNYLNEPQQLEGTSNSVIVYKSLKANTDETFTGDIGVICGVDGNL